MRRRVFILPAAAVAIGALVAWKLTRDHPPQPVLSGRPVAFERAPPLEGLDSENRMVRIDPFLGRHPIVVIFFDGALGAARDERSRALRERFDSVEAAGARVVAVSAALPQENRRAIEQTGPFPFPLVSDPAFEIHRAWGRFDDANQRPLQGIFLVDRAGNVGFQGGRPQPLSLDEALARVTLD